MTKKKWTNDSLKKEIKRLTTCLIYLSFRGHIYDIYADEDGYQYNDQLFTSIENLILKTPK